MSASQVSLLSVVILLFPLAYFFLASLTFFLATLQDPVVTRVLRGLFNTYFIGLVGCSALATASFTAIGRLPVAAVVAAVCAGAVLSRRWFLRQIDRNVAARQAGDPAAIPRLRRLHVTGIAYNAAHLALLFASIPSVVTAR